MGKQWRFEQLGGQQRVLTLDGASAPHGRERKDTPLVSDGAKLRRQRQYYSGHDVPTTHIFGVSLTDWELKGRFQDSYLGKGGTKLAISNWLTFLAAQQPIRVTWGDILSVEGILDEFIPGRESEAHSTYKMTILIDKRSDVSFLTQGPSENDPSLICAWMRDEIATSMALPRIEGLGNLASLADSITENIANAVSSLNSISAEMVSITQGFDDFTSAIEASADRLQSGARQMRTAATKLLNTIAEIDSDLSIVVISADADLARARLRTETEASVAVVLGLLADLDEQIDRAVRGRKATTYVAVAGDTWESIATALYGGPDKAGKLRDANGVRFGELPQSGRTYQVPSS